MERHNESVNRGEITSHYGGLDPQEFLAILTGTMFGSRVHRIYGDMGHDSLLEVAWVSGKGESVRITGLMLPRTVTA